MFSTNIRQYKENEMVLLENLFFCSELRSIIPRYSFKTGTCWLKLSFFTETKLFSSIFAGFWFKIIRLDVFDLHIACYLALFAQSVADHFLWILNANYALLARNCCRSCESRGVFWLPCLRKLSQTTGQTNQDLCKRQITEIMYFI